MRVAEWPMRAVGSNRPDEPSPRGCIRVHCCSLTSSE
jgi:hypothetical protein